MCWSELDGGQVMSTKQLELQPSGPWQLSKDQVRVLLYRECDVRGRKLLYDSSTVVRVPVTENPSSSSCKTLFRQHRVSSSSTTQASSPSKSSGSMGAGQGGKACLPPSPVRTEHYSEISNGYGYQYRKQASDGKAVGELVFGSVALAYRGATSKVHLLQDPPRFIASRITLAPKSYRASHGSCDQGLEDSWGSSMSSLGEAVLLRAEGSTSLTATPAHGISWPVEMPRILSSANSEGDSGFVGPPSCSSSLCSSFLSPPSLPNTPMGTPSSQHGSGSSLNGSGSLNSLQRRFLRNVNTSLEALTKQQQHHHQHSGSGGNCSSGGEEGSEDSGSYVPSQHVTRLGMAVIISTATANGDLASSQQMESWLLSHLGAVEVAINKLHTSLESAYLHRRSFVSSTHQAVVQFQQDITDLVNGPRLTRPVWLSMLADECSERDNLCRSFITTLTHILEHYDTKHTSFFVSKLLTAVLTHHLGWVSTVAPAEILASETDATTSNQTPTPHWTESLSQSHPYNAVWAQLCELSGALGYPPKVARTVLLGSNKVLLLQFLTVLSYLIRCSEVIQQIPERPDPATTALTSNEGSRTSSVTSIVTVLESDRRDSSGRLRRDLSGRYSNRRTSALSMRERWLSDRFVCTPDHAEDRDCRTGEVFEERRSSKSGGDKSVLFCEQVQTQTLRESELKDDRAGMVGSDNMDAFSRTCSHSKGAPYVNISVGLHGPQDCTKQDDSKRGFTKTKTALNLQQLVKGEDQDRDFKTVPRLNVSQANSESTSSESLYPTLHDMEDHRHTFGPITLEPDNIAHKVSKLIRVPSDASRALRSASRTSGADCGLNRAMGCMVPKETRKEITVPSKAIKAEEEMGGKVLFLLGDNERLEGLKKDVGKSEVKKDQHPENKKVTLHVEHHPGDIRRRTQVRALGREYIDSLAESKLGSRYPSLHQLQLDLSRSASDSNCKAVMSGHVRRHSDPINGTHILSNKTSLPFTLKQLKEEVAVEPEARTTDQSVSFIPSVLHDHEEIFGTVCSSDSPGTSSSNFVEEEGHGDKFSDSVSPLRGSVFNRSSSSCSGSSEGGNSFTEEAELIPMPSLELSQDAKLSEDTAQRSPAWSALGGVFDHYSSAFLVHATTQTKNWEDALCHDLSVATRSHHPLLGHHLAEAVAVVADTESWDVQIVSSHTIVVERGSGAQVGLRVGMSPIVSSITDSLLQLARLHVHPNFIVKHFEDRLRELYVKSQLLAEYLLAGSIGSPSGAFPSSKGVNSPYHLPALTHALGVDLNDLPLLLSVASTHTPALTRMFGLTFK